MANNLNELNFNCNEVLQASDLNLIVSNLKAALQNISDHETLIQSLQGAVENIVPGGGGGGQGNPGSSGVSTIMAFKGFISLEAANSAYDQIKEYEGIPGGWATTSNASLNDGEMLFMIVAYRQGNTWQKTEGIVWLGPYRLGSSGTTSGTGTDSSEYNYIYCRTTEASTAPSDIVPDNNSTFVSIMDSIEGETPGTMGAKGGYNKSGTRTSEQGVANYYYDHPFGVTTELPCEWTVCLKNTNGTWAYHWGPVCTSHWGQNGLDGDGLEYIFYLQAANDTSTPTWSNPASYTGKYRNPSDRTLFIPVSSAVGINSIEYLHDDFIPTDWHDEPQEVSNLYPRLFVSTRKKTGALELGNLWGLFTNPKLWNVYATNGGQVTLDNDSIIIDDNTSSDAIEYVSLTKAFLWDGLTDVTFDRNRYPKITVTMTCSSNLSSLLTPCKITGLNGNDVITTAISWGTAYNLGTAYDLNNSNFSGFCVKKTNISADLPKDTGGSISYTIHAYESINSQNAAVVGTKSLSFLIVDFNSRGTSYSLLVQPNTLPVSRVDENSNYSYSGSNYINITATGATGTEVEQMVIKNDLLNASEGDLYVVVKRRIGGQLFASGVILSYPTEDNNKIIRGDLTGESGALVTSIESFEVELYYKYSSGSILVDSETVNFSVKGDRGPSGTGTGGSAASENMKWIFKRFDSLLSAQTAVSGLNNNITSNSQVNWSMPSGWSVSDDDATGTGDLYMAYCYVLDGKFVVLSELQNNLTVYFIWYGPFRIGSGSDAGADDENYNYVYCRTVGNSAASFIPTNPATWDIIAKAIENSQNTNSQNTIFVNKDGETTSTSYVEGYWTDHPLGVSLSEPYEWEVGLTFDGTDYTYAYGPIIRSHFGLNGRDGDGYEYIFYLKPINGSVPTWSNPASYTGKYRNPSDRTLFITVSSAVGINSTEYLHDDFIPTDWEDNNQTLSAAFPVEYMSKRKKENGNWGAFSTPVVWRTYATDGFKVTLDNDVVVFDDDSGNDLIKAATLTKVYLWDGDLDVTINNSYDHIDVEVTYVGDNSTNLSPGQVSSISGSTITISNVDKNNSTPSWGSLFSLPSSNYNGFALTKTVSNTKLSQTTGLVVYTVKVYKTSSSLSPEIVASKALSILILNIGDPASYLLQVSPNTLLVSRPSSTSSYALDTNTFTVSVLGLKEDNNGELSISSIPITASIPSSGIGFYITLKTSNGDTISSTPTSSNNILTYTITNLSNSLLVVGNIKYINVELYYYDGTNSTRLDVETIDFSIKGDLGLPGTVQGTEGYIIASLNDGAVIDDLTTTESDVLNATINPIKVYQGNNDITNSCTYTISKWNMPTYMKILGSGSVSANVTLGSDILGSSNDNISGSSNYSGYKVLALTVDSNIPNNYTWPEGKDYEYDVTITDSNNNEIGIKKFRLVIDANISDDGSYYKLIVNNDVISYDSDGTVLSNSTPTISVYHYSISEELLPFSMVSSLPNNPNSDTIYVVVGSLYSYFNYNSNTKIATMSSYPAYNANGYEISAYKGSRYIDSPEIIDCIKKGADASLYDIIPSETSLHFNVDDLTNEWTPSAGLSLTCTATKTVGSTVTTIGYNYNQNDNLDGYYLYYKTFSGTTQVTNYTQHYENNPITISPGNTETRITTVVFYLKTPSGNPIKSCVVPVTRDGKKGQDGSNSTGSVGRFYYFAGDWNEVGSLKVTPTSCPYVYLNGKYYMYIGNLTGNDLTRNSLLNGGDDPSNSNLWEEMEYNRYAISDAMFANYAHLGSLVINRDWMISLYGYFNNATETESDSYTYFDPISFMYDINKTAKIGVIYGDSSSTNNIASLIFKLNGSATATITFNGTIKLFKFNDSSIFRFNNSGTIGNTTNDLYKINTDGFDKDGNYVLFTPSGGTYTDFLSSSNGTETKTITISSSGAYCFVGGNISKIEILYSNNLGSIFIPHFALDLRSGFLYTNNAYVKGDITATSFSVLRQNSTNKSIEFTAVKREWVDHNDPNFLNNKKQGMIDAGLLTGDPVGLIYDSSGNMASFFDFAPVNTYSLSLSELTTYNIVSTASSGAITNYAELSIDRVIYYVNDDGLNSNLNGKYVSNPRNNSLLVNNYTFYLKIKSITSVKDSGSNTYVTTPLTIFRLYSINLGVISSSNNYIILENVTSTIRGTYKLKLIDNTSVSINSNSVSDGNGGSILLSSSNYIGMHLPVDRTTGPSLSPLQYNNDEIVTFVSNLGHVDLANVSVFKEYLSNSDIIPYY